jgi:hypothetical protein
LQMGNFAFDFSKPLQQNDDFLRLFCHTGSMAKFW